MKNAIATNVEVPDILHLNKYVQEIHAKEHPDIFKGVVGHEEGSKFFNKIINDENSRILICYNESSPVGYIWAQIRLETKMKHLLLLNES